jgi:glutamine amidotransferase-like uncharacterized protein
MAVCLGAIYGNRLRGKIAWHPLLFIACLAFVVAFVTACGGGGKGHRLAGGPAPVLLYNGSGVSVNDVTAIEAVLNSNHLKYVTVSSGELNGMSQSQLMSYRLLIVPGGDFIHMGNSLDTATATNIRRAVQHGLNYFGICAGAFLAGNSTYYNGFNLTSGITFGFYSAENKGIRKAALAISSAAGPTLDQYWEDGPLLSNWGAVVAKYPDGTPAVAEAKCGKGFVILAGIHAEAPENWRGGMGFNTPTGTCNAYAATLIRAALNGASLPHY